MATYIGGYAYSGTENEKIARQKAVEIRQSVHVPYAIAVKRLERQYNREIYWLDSEAVSGLTDEQKFSIVGSFAFGGYVDGNRVEVMGCD